MEMEQTKYEARSSSSGWTLRVIRKLLVSPESMQGLEQVKGGN